jgi:hypothetical protein
MRTLFLSVVCLLTAGRLLAGAHPDSLRRHVVRLSTLPDPRNREHPESLEDAAAYFEQHFRRYAPITLSQRFKQGNQTFRNVLCSIGPEKAARLVLGAHYDVAGRIPGADGNASGVAVLLELARMLAPASKNLRIRIDLVAFTLAEGKAHTQARLGSRLHARYLQESKVSVIGMIALRGLGSFRSEVRTQRYPFLTQNTLRRRKGDFLALIPAPGSQRFRPVYWNLLRQYAGKFPVKQFRPALPFPVLAWSDHRSYAELGYPAVLLTNTLGYRNKYFGYDADAFQTLDYFRMSKAAELIFQTLIRYPA